MKMSHNRPKTSISDTNPNTPYVVHFVVGKLTPHSATYAVDLQTAVRSPYLRNIIYPPPLGLQTLRVEVPHADPQAFSLYISWLGQKTVSFPDHEQPQGPHAPGQSLTWVQCYPLIAAYILGARFQHPEFQDCIFDALDWWLAPRQKPSVEILQYVFNEGVPVPKLKCFVVDRMFATEMERLEILGLFVARVLEGKCGVLGLGATCEYHVHPKSEACTRASRRVTTGISNSKEPMRRTQPPEARAAPTPASPRTETKTEPTPSFQEF
ncbi:hypothetical protein K505DRAFT_398665, partial [Melanomma pulvis-pyrius CBS 109.77]